MLSAGGEAVDAIIGPLQRNGHSVMVLGDLDVALPQINEQHLVILDARDDATLAMMCRRITDETGSHHPPILAVAKSPSVDVRVQLLEAGADDVVAQPVDEREIEAMAEALMLRAPEPAPSNHETAVALPRPVPSAPGRIVAFFAAKGGSGTTTLAVNTALVLAEMAPGSVAVVDLDMMHGQVSTHLDIYARDSTAQIVHEDRAAQGADAIHDAGKQHSSGLMVFGGPYRPDEGADLTGEQLSSFVQALRPLYGTTIVDVGSSPDMRALYVLARADRVIMPITPDIPSLRLVHAALQVMSDAGGVTDKTLFVLNEIYPRSMITAEQIEEHLGIHISLTVPYEGDNFMRAINEGHPLVSFARRGPAGSALKRLAELTADTKLEETEVVVQPVRRVNRFRSILGRS